MASRVRLHLPWANMYPKIHLGHTQIAISDTSSLLQNRISAHPYYLWGFVLWALQSVASMYVQQAAPKVACSSWTPSNAKGIFQRDWTVLLMSCRDVHAPSQCVDWSAALTWSNTEPSGIVMRMQNLCPASQREIMLTSSMLEYGMEVSMKPNGCNDKMTNNLQVAIFGMQGQHPASWH